MTDDLKLPKTLGEADLGGGLFLFPGRWEGRIRGMRVAEENLLLDRRLRKGGAAFNELLRACVETNTDPLDLLVGDRVFALLQIRRLTYGDEYAFRASCPRCDEGFEWQEDLSTLVVQYLADPGEVAPDHTFEFVLPRAQRRVRWRLLRGKDEATLARIRADSPDAVASLALVLRTVEIEGEKLVSRRFFDELEAADAAAFRAEINARECGVETSIEVDCPACGARFEMDLPIGAGFFLPGTVREAKTTRRKAR